MKTLNWYSQIFRCLSFYARSFLLWLSETLELFGDKLETLSITLKFWKWGANFGDTERGDQWCIASSILVVALKCFYDFDYVLTIVNGKRY